MDSKNILLTISILISNRPDTVEKCLQSLDTLREKVPCELILTDTGCGEQVRAIIEKYADVILEFEWCRDFAKARNLGIDAAKGEWFMFMDDDEWFENTDEIEQFFLSGQYQNYGAALYLVRNYGNLKGTVYSDAPVSRMARLGEGVRFKYAIHETFDILVGSAKLLHSYVHHYGYVYKSKSEAYKHSQRNIIPLLKEHEKEPDNLRHNAQLAQEYNGIGEHIKSIEISLKGIEYYDGQLSNLGNLNSLFVNVVERHMHMYRYEEALAYAEQYIADDRINRLGMAKICMLVARAAFELEQYEKCEKFCGLYLMIFDDYCENEDWYTTRAGLFLNNAFEEKKKNEILCINIAAALRLKHFDGIREKFDTIDLERKILLLDIELLKSTIDIFVSEKVSEEHVCVYLLNKLFEREQLHSQIIECMEETRKEYPDKIKDSSSKWDYLICDCWYISYLKLGMAVSKEDGVWEMFYEVWKKPQNVLMRSRQLGLWELAEKAGIDMGQLIGEIPYYRWQEAAVVTCSSLEMDELLEIGMQIEKVCKEESVYLKCWRFYLAKKQLDVLEDECELPETEVVNILSGYSKAATSLAKEVYKEEVVEYNQDMLPADIQVAFCVGWILEFVKTRQYILAIQKIREVNKLRPSFSVALKVYTRWMENQMQEEQRQQDKEKDELVQLGKKIKDKVRFLIEQQMYEEAELVLTQLRNMMPGDVELELLRERIVKKGF